MRAYQLDYVFVCGVTKVVESAEANRETGEHAVAGYVEAKAAIYSTAVGTLIAAKTFVHEMYDSDTFSNGDHGAKTSDRVMSVLALEIMDWYKIDLNGMIEYSIR